MSRIATPVALLATLVVIACAACAPPEQPSAPPALRVVTFNTGTTEGIADDVEGGNGGYGAAQGAYSDQYYGDGLAWRAAIDDVRAFFASLDADIVAFQEIFSVTECAAIPPEARAGFVCETWADGDPGVPQQVLGDDYAIACNLGKPDKCLAVKRSVGAIRGCDGGLCLDGLDGGNVEGCGSGSRVGRAVVDLAGGGALTVVPLHGTSGMTTDDMHCRVQQFDQVFVDLLDGSGEPAVRDDAPNVVLGDLNTDPARLVGADPSADRLADHINFATPFHFVSPVGKDVQPTYAFFNIDHVVSDVYGGACRSIGITEGTEPVSPVRYFDHHPLVCDLRVVDEPE